jgi:hypothetical protein
MTYIDQLKSPVDLNLQSIVTLRDKFKRTMVFFVQLLLVVLTIGAPIYIVRGDDDNALSTHINTYAWFWTLAYLRGFVPSSLIMVSWVFTITVCFYRIILVPLIEEIPAESKPLISPCKSHSSSDEATPNNPLGNAKARGWIVGVFLGNAAVAITVNTVYVYFTQQPLSVLIRFGIQLSLAVFRLVYTSCVIPVLSRTIADPVANIGFQLRLLIMNNLVVPCIVTAFASPSCFQVSFFKKLHY